MLPGDRPPSGWPARRRPLREIDPRLQPVREMFARVDAVAERAGRLTQGQSAVSGRPAIVTPVDGQSTAISMTKSFLEALTVIPLTLFFLLGGPPLLARMGASLSGNEASVRTLRLTEAIRFEVGRYFGTVALINIGLGACTALAMYALGMPNAILWGVLVAVFNFVPYLGPIAAFFILSIAALVTFESLGRALAVPGIFLFLHLIEGQIVQPLTVGRRFEVNALVVLLAVWFGYGFWGIPGDVAGHAGGGGAQGRRAVPAELAHGAGFPLAQWSLAPAVTEARTRGEGLRLLATCSPARIGSLAQRLTSMAHALADYVGRNGSSLTCPSSPSSS